MAYYLTPAERRARAQALIEQRKNVVAYNKYLKQQKDYEKQVAQAKLDEENRQKQIESQDFFTRAISTVGDISANIITGALKGLEGIYDLGAGIVGAVGGIFSDDFQDSVKSHIATDWVGKYIGDPLQELTKYSYTKNGGIIEGVASGIGQMLPAVAVTIATDGAGAPAAVAQMASLATLGASAAGNATEQAYNDGASYWGGLGYGLASGAVEMATEKMFGGFGKLAGAGYLDNVTRSIAKQGIARVAKEAVEEGVEEIVAELANPALKAIYKGGEAFQEYGDADYWKGVGEAGLIGGLTSMAYGQTVGRVLHSSGKYADVNESLAEVDSLAQKARNLSETGKLYEKAKNGKVNSDTIHDSMVENLRLIEQTVKKVDETKRAKFIKQAHLTDVVNPDGSIKSEFAMSRGLSDMVAQQSTEGGETAQSPLASQPKQYRTAFADERVLKEALDRGGATAFVGEMTSEQASDFGDFTKVFGKLSNKSNGFLKFVVGENVQGNSYIDTQTGTVVMGVDQFGKGTSGVDLANAVITSDMWQKSAIHEVKHSTEGTKQDTKLTQHLYDDNAVFAEARDSFLRRGYFNERVDDTSKAGEYLDGLLVKVDEVMRSKPKNVSMEEHITANLTPQEIQDYRTAQSEIAAIAAENVLGNESFIKKLLRKDTNFAQKVLNRIMDMKEAFASLKSKEARNAYTYLNKAEKLYLKAIEEVGARFQKRRIIGIRRLEEGEEVDASPQSEYNGEEVVVQHSRKDSLINRTFPTYKESAGSEANTLATRWAHRADIEVGDRTAISYYDKWYLVEKFENSDLGYQIVAQISEKQYQEFIEERNNGIGKGQSIQKSVSVITSIDRRRDSSVGRVVSDDSVSPRNGRGDNQIQRVGEEQSQRGKTQSNRSGNSEGGGQGKRGVKYSLSDEGEGFVHHDSAFYESEKGKRIASTMNMETCKQMIERVYYLINPNQYEESPIYKNAEHWLSIVGADEVALYIENEYILQEKYLNKIPAVLEGDVYVGEIIEAYQDKALNGGNNKKAAKRLNVAEGVESNDSRFYAPQRVEEAKKLYEVANQKVTNANRSEVNEARARILIFAHNRGAASELGITQTELNKKLRSWSNYSTNAREISQRINEGVAFANMWSGIENSSYLYNATITEEDFAPLVGKIEGRSSEYERRYIANTMLALDTHIDYTGINFVFGENFTEKGVRGKYSDSDRTVSVRGGAGQQTVAHEIGHAIDHQWARDVWNWVDRKSTGSNNGLSEGINLDLVTIPEVKQWVENYFAFIDNISDSGNIHSEYLQSKNEVFARFVAQFVEWTSQLATGRSSLYSFSDFNDKFTMAQFVEFARILQEKAKLDTKFHKTEAVESPRKDIKFSRKEQDNVYHFINKLARIEISWNKSNDTYHLYCENSKGYLEYEGTLTEEQIESRFGEEFGMDLESRAIEQGGQVAIIDRSWIGYYADEIKPVEKYDDDYLTEAKEQYGTTDNVLLAGYINTDGSMLDFSGGYESRFIDHSEIDVIFDDESGVDAMYAYMRMGNIRLMPEAPSLEFNSKVEPTSQQYDTIQKAIDTLIEKNGKFYIEFTSDEGSSVANRQYERGVPTSRILDDISYFYKNGKLPYQSDLSQFRYSRKAIDDTAKPTYYHLSDGQIKKMLANNTRFKVYTKADAEGIINNVLQNYMSFGEKYGDMSGKTKTQVIDMLWKGLNSAKPGHQMAVALNIADYIIQNSALESLYGDMENAEVQQALDIIGALKPYLHRVNLDSIKGEIKHKYDNDNSAYLLWGKRKGESGLGADQIAQELQAKGIQIEAINEADIFFEIDAQYRNAVKALKKKAKDMLAEVLPKEQQKALKQDIAKEVLRGFDYTGKSSQLASVLDKYRKQISDLYDKLRDSNRHNRATNRLLDKVQKIKNWKTGAFVNSSKYRPKLFKGSIERLAMIKNRGNLNQSGTRRILAGLAEWYAKDNPILGFVDDEHIGLYNGEIASILQAVAQNQKPLTDEQVDLISYLQDKSGISDYKGLLEWYTKENLKKGYSSEVKSLLRELASETTFTTEELIALEKVVGYFGNLVENYNKVIRNGKYVDAKPIAERYVNTLRANKTVKVGWIGKFFDKVFNNGKASYLQTFADPMTVARYMDKYESGFFTEMLEELRNGAIRADVTEMQIRMPLEEFLAKHKKYGRGVSKRTVTYRGVELPALDAFLLYMTLNREQALAGLAEAGFAFNNGKETIRVDGFAKGSEDLTLDELRELARAEQEDLYKQFTEEDKEYISIAEKIFNEDCKETKRATDMLRMGYSNVFEGYYVPIRRANSAVTVDSGTFFDEMNRVSNASFNKDTVRGAKGELYIEGLDEVLDRHIHGISQYASLATVIDQYDILYNVNMTEDANKPQTVRTESENTWAKGNEYFKKLISDVQGISPTRGGGSKLFGFLRSGYAKYQLGLNPKVWLTQLSSIFASSSILDYSSIVKGFGIKSPDVDDYCSLAAVRNNDNSAAMAQSVLDKVDKFGSALMKPIGKVDRFVIKRLFGACQVQVQKESGLKIGTKENKVKAGELLERVILETQQNAMATERSAAMRSGSELMKTITMFTADSMKVFGRVVDSFGEVSVLKHKIKETTDPKAKEALQAQLKAANKKARKSVTALAATAIFMALVAQAFRWLYGKDDDDESVLETMTVDAIGNLMGGLPLIKDLYGALMEGYELNNYAYSAINDLFDAFSSIVNFSEGKPAQKVKNIVYAVGQIFGIPTRNVYNIFYGLTKRFSPTTAYEIDNAFYNKNYSADLQKAIDNDDEDMIATITGIMLDEKVGAIESTTAKKELNSLVAAGYKVLPRSIGNSITYNGEEIALTSRQREQFKSVYSEANSQLASLVEGKAYRSASEEVKAKAIAFIWDIYYNLAIEDLLGVDLETKNTLFAKAIDIPSLAIIVATARGFEADTDKKGKVISGSRKAKVQGYVNSLGLRAAQKYMIMGYLGYSNKNGSNQVRSYIQRLRLSKSEKEKLYEYSGYAA